MRRAVGIAALGLLALGAYGFWHFGLGTKAGGTTAAPAVPTVHVATAKVQDMPVRVRGLGRVAPFNAVQVKSRVDGPIMRILFKEGDEVRAGDPLIEIDPRPYQAALAQAEGQMARDQAQLAAAKADLDRSSSLVQRGFATRQTVDQQTAQVGQFAAAVKTDQGILDNARLNLDFATIRAPIAGRIGKRLVDAGNLVHTSDGVALVEIVQLHPIAVLLTVPQNALPEIKARLAEAPLTVEAMAPDEREELATGRLALIGNEIDTNTGTIELKAEFDNADGKLWPGQLVTARVVTSIRRNAVAVPLAAVLPGPDGKFAYVVDAESKVAVRPVKLGAPIGGNAVVESGLKPGEVVVLDGQDLLAPGMAVKTESKAAESTADGPAMTEGKPAGEPT